MIVKNLSISYDSNDIIDKISFILNENDKVGLLGQNGSGKTTLLKALAGIIKTEKGSINLNNQTIDILRQEIDYKDYNLSIIDYLKQKTKTGQMEKKLHEYENNLTEKNMGAYSDLLDYFLRIDGYNFDDNLKYILNGLNLNKSLDFKVGNLSGGEKIKVLLSVILMSKPDIMLFDEPTNNLDLESIVFLEKYLCNINNKMIIVSHDEEFLNKVVNRIFELNNGKLKEYNMTYNSYLEVKNNEYNNELKKYEQAVEKKKELEKKIVETTSWSSKGTSGKKKTDNDKLSHNYSKERAKKTSGKISQLHKQLDNLQGLSFSKKEEMSFDIAYDDGKGSKDIYIYDLICGYDEFKTPQINIDIPFGTRITITGPNGSGKTTFIKTILREISPLKGTISVGNSVKFGYISQNTFETYSDLTIYEYLTSNLKEVDKSLLYTILDKFYIDYEDRNKKYNLFSPGERAKVNLAKLSLNQINVLILDEVTNHLDIETIRMVSDVVENFKGTIINISHNRRFNEVVKPNIVFDIQSGCIVNENKKERKR